MNASVVHQYSTHQMMKEQFYAPVVELSSYGAAALQLHNPSQHFDPQL